MAGALVQIGSKAASLAKAAPPAARVPVFVLGAVCIGGLMVISKLTDSEVDMGAGLDAGEDGKKGRIGGWFKIGKRKSGK